MDGVRNKIVTKGVHLHKRSQTYPKENSTSQLVVNLIVISVCVQLVGTSIREQQKMTSATWAELQRAQVWSNMTPAAECNSKHVTRQISCDLWNDKHALDCVQGDCYVFAEGLGHSQCI
jgi:hypothetical protein